MGVGLARGFNLEGHSQVRNKTALSPLFFPVASFVRQKDAKKKQHAGAAGHTRIAMPGISIS
jgi:hypothetical protein